MDDKTMAMVDNMTAVLSSFGMDVIAALAILVIGWMFAGWAERRTRGLLTRTGKIDATLHPFLCGVVRYFILVIVIVAVLGQFGIETASIIAVLGTAGLAIGLAMQGTLSHFAAGVVLLILRPFRVGEFIDTGS